MQNHRIDLEFHCNTHFFTHFLVKRSFVTADWLHVDERAVLFVLRGVCARRRQCSSRIFPWFSSVRSQHLGVQKCGTDQLSTRTDRNLQRSLKPFFFFSSLSSLYHAGPLGLHHMQAPQGHRWKQESPELFRWFTWCEPCQPRKNQPTDCTPTADLLRADISLYKGQNFWG